MARCARGPPRPDLLPHDWDIDCPTIPVKYAPTTNWRRPPVGRQSGRRQPSPRCLSLCMPDVIFTGPDGRLEGRYHQSKTEHAPIAIILHPHPQYGGNMNNKVVFTLFHVFVNRGFSVLRFNTRGVGRSQGAFDNGQGELSDAAAALDWLQSMNPDAKQCWIAGFSFGAWIGMQLLMRRPEIDGF